MKKLIALLACAAMLLSLLAGCGSGTEVEYYDSQADGAAEDAQAPLDAEAEQTAAPEAPVAADPDGGETEAYIMLGGTGYETYDPETVVGVVAGTDVTWEEYFYWLNFYANYYTQMAAARGTTLTSWDAVGELSSQNSNAAALTELTLYTIRQYHAVAEAAAKEGVELSEEDQARLEENIERSSDADGDGVVTDEERTAFEDTLAAQYVDTDFAKYLDGVGLLSTHLFEKNFGENGEKCSDDIAAQYVEDKGILSAKHILLVTVDRSTRESLDDETIAQKRETAETLQKELAAVQDDKQALIALFDEYMAEYSEDTGYAANPNGYVFEPGQMVTEFEEGVKALDPNYGLSDVVESSYGYHIIMRQPVTADTVIGLNSSGEDITVRYAAAQEQFTAMLSAWTDSAQAQWNEGFDAPDMQAIFG